VLTSSDSGRKELPRPLMGKPLAAPG